MPAEGQAVPPATLCVRVVYCAAPGQCDERPLQLPPGALVGDALAQSGLLAAHGLVGQTLDCGVWGRLSELDAPLRDGDRVEVYRPLLVDPKEARRVRYKRKKDVGLPKA